MEKQSPAPSFIPLETWAHFWHPVCTLSEFREARPEGRGPHQVSLLGQTIALVEIDEAIVAFRDRCCHRSASLSLGCSETGGLRCAYHGWKYGSDGKCIEIPSRPDMAIPDKARVPTYACRTAYGLVWVRLDSSLDLTDIPAHPAWDDDRYKCVFGKPYTWRTSAGRRVENFIDLAHFAFIHPNSLGDPDRPEVPPVEVSRANGEMRFYFEMPKPEKRLETSWIGDISYRLPMPFTVNLDLRNSTLEDVGDAMLWMTASPVREGVCRCYYFISRTGAHDKADEPHTNFQEIVLAEDIGVVESQYPPEIPIFDRTFEEISVATDALSIQYRKWCSEIYQSVRSASADAFEATLYPERQEKASRSPAA